MYSLIETWDWSSIADGLGRDDKCFLIEGILQTSSSAYKCMYTKVSLLFRCRSGFVRRDVAVGHSQRFTHDFRPYHGSDVDSSRKKSRYLAQHLPAALQILHRHWRWHQVCPPKHAIWFCDQTLSECLKSLVTNQVSFEASSAIDLCWISCKLQSKIETTPSTAWYSDLRVLP